MKRATEDQPRRKTARRRRSPLNGRIVTAGVIVLLAILWVTYWYGASQIGAAVLDRIAAAAAARGYAAACDDIAGGGFPLSVDLSCSRASVAGAEGLEATIDGFSTTTPLYRPWSIRSMAAGPLTVRLPASGSGMTASWQTAETTIEAWIGGLSGVETRLEGLQLDLPDGAEAPPFDGVSLELGDVTISPASGDDYRLSAVAHGIAFQSGNVGDLPEIDLDANLSALEFGDSLGLDPRRALAEWIAGGGRLRIDDLTVATDTVSARVAGVLALSPKGTLSGDLDVTLAGVEELPDLVESFYPAARDQTEQIVAAAIAFTRSVETPAGPARQMTLLVRDGVISIGILPIGVIPAIAF